MHLIKLSEVNHSEIALTRAVIQIAQMLGMYHAELARILFLQCSDVGDLTNAKASLKKHSTSWQSAEKLVTLFEKLFDYCDGNEAKMHNWLRKYNSKLDGEPLYLIVDELRIDDVVQVL